MEKRRIQIEYSVFDNLEELPQEDQRVLLQARKARGNAYSPYSGFRVGAAVLLQNGEVITGNNQENAAYPSGLCAERVALFYAAAKYPAIALKTIAISALGNDTDDSAIQSIKPCGACCQVLAEYESLSNFPIRIILDGNSAIQVLDGTCSLLPFQFKKIDLSGS